MTQGGPAPRHHLPFPSAPACADDPVCCLGRKVLEKEQDKDVPGHIPIYLIIISTHCKRSRSRIYSMPLPHALPCRVYSSTFRYLLSTYWMPGNGDSAVKVQGREWARDTNLAVISIRWYLSHRMGTVTKRQSVCEEKKEFVPPPHFLCHD